MEEKNGQSLDFTPVLWWRDYEEASFLEREALIKKAGFTIRLKEILQSNIEEPMKEKILIRVLQGYFDDLLEYKDWERTK